MKKIFLFVICNLFLGWTIAQNVEFTKENFPDNLKQLKTAVQNIKKGDDVVKSYTTMTTDYALALEYYQKANQFNPRNAVLNNKIANCYKQMNNYVGAVKFGAKAYDLNPNLNLEVVFYKACYLHLNENFTEAIAMFEKIINNATSTEMQKSEAQKHIAECQYARKMIKDEVLCFIDNLGNVVNSAYDDYGAVVSIDDSTLYFNSRRQSEKNIITADGKYFERIYVTHLQPNGTYTTPVQVAKLCTKGHSAIQALSKDGKHVVVYRDKRGGNLYESNLKKGKFSRPKKMKNINTSGHETSASYSPTGDTLYFCSDRSGGLGLRDVYMATRNKKKWNKPINLGSTINTIGDEISVYAHADGKTLYICSDGHETMGGIDVFKVENVNGIWQKPENVGYPISTTNDDVYFVVTADNRHAYYSSDKEGGIGEQDIYKLTLLGQQKYFALYAAHTPFCGLSRLDDNAQEAMHIEEDKITIVKGFVQDAVSKQPVFATIELSDVAENELLATFTSDSVSGEYLLSLPAGKNYAVAIKAQGYLFHSENFDIPEEADKQTIEQIISMERIAVNKTIVLKNIFFDNAKSTLRKESLVEIENVYNLLMENPTMEVEISGHTDNVGGAKYNQNLSKNRAKAVVDALVAKGINISRLTSKGYGYTKPVATNTTAEGRQLNRRTEFKVTKM